MNYDIEEFCCPTCLAVNAIKAMYELLDLKDSDDCYASTAIICKEELAEQLLREFMNVEVNGFEFNVEYIDFNKIDYENEYAIVIDTEGTLSLDKMYFEDGELKTFGEDLVFISDECNSRIFIEQCEFDEDAVIAFSLDDDE